MAALLWILPAWWQQASYYRRDLERVECQYRWLHICWMPKPILGHPMVLIRQGKEDDGLMMEVYYWPHDRAYRQKRMGMKNEHLNFSTRIMFQSNSQWVCGFIDHLQKQEKGVDGLTNSKQIVEKCNIIDLSGYIVKKSSFYDASICSTRSAWPHNVQLYMQSIERKLH